MVRGMYEEDEVVAKSEWHNTWHEKSHVSSLYKERKCEWEEGRNISRWSWWWRKRKERKERKKERKNERKEDILSLISGVSTVRVRWAES